MAHRLPNEQCCGMLINDRNKSAAEIAGLVGYDSASKFAAAFKRIMGRTPIEYRKDIR